MNEVSISFSLFLMSRDYYLLLDSQVLDSLSYCTSLLVYSAVGDHLVTKCIKIVNLYLRK